MKFEPRRQSAKGDAETAGFTLLEMMAVIVIIVVLSTLLFPELGFTTQAALRAEGRELAAYLEIARQRAVMTGKPHRVQINLDEGAYWVEWYGNEAEINGTPPGPSEEDLDLNGELPLRPPIDNTYAYYAVPNKFGRGNVMDAQFYFDGVETANDWYKDGEVSIVFDRDGSTDPSEIVITEDDGRTVLLQISPLMETVRIHDET